MGLELNPVPYIYSPPMSLYGGVVITNRGVLFSDLERLTKEVTDSIYQAYKIRNYVDCVSEPDFKAVKSVLTPNSGFIDDKAFDYHSWNEVTLNRIINQLKVYNKEQAIIIDDSNNKFYFAQLLGDDFNPLLIKNLLVAIQSTALFLAGERACKVDGYVIDDLVINLAKLPFYDYFI